MKRRPRQRTSASHSASMPPGPACALQLWPLRPVALVVAAACLFRLLMWLWYSRTPFFHQPVVDASFFDLWARSIVAGRRFQPDVFFKPPLYPYALALLYRLFGPSPPVVYAVQMLLGVASSLLVLAVGRLVFTPRIALTAAVATALLPILPFLELQLVAETLTTFLSLLGLLLIVQAVRPEPLPSGRRLLGAGLLLGLAALGRPNVLLLIPVLALWLGWSTRSRSAARALSAWLRPAAVLLLGSAVAIAPVTLRNFKISGQFVPVCANFGVNFWTGQSATADGTSPIPVGVQWDDLQLRCEQAGAHGAEASSRLLTREALAQIGTRPLRALWLLLKKIVVLVGAVEVRNNIGPGFLAREFGILPLSRWWPGFWLLGPLALLGLGSARRWGHAAQPLVLYVLALGISVLPFFVNARFRAPLLPVLALFAATGLFDLVGRLQAARHGRTGSFVRSLPVVVAVFLLVNVNWFGLGHLRQDAQDEANLAGILAKGYDDVAADHELACRHFQRAIELDSQDPDLYQRYGEQLLRHVQPWVRRTQDLADRGQWRPALAASDSAAGELRLALQLHERAASLYPRSWRSWTNAGSCRLWLGDGSVVRAQLALAAGDTARACSFLEEGLTGFTDAVRNYQRALSIDPHYAEAASNLTLGLQRILALPPLTAAVRESQEAIARQSRVDKG